MNIWVPKTYTGFSWQGYCPPTITLDENKLHIPKYDDASCTIPLQGLQNKGLLKFDKWLVGCTQYNSSEPLNSCPFEWKNETHEPYLVDDLRVAMQLSLNWMGTGSDEITFKSSTRGIKKLLCPHHHDFPQRKGGYGTTCFCFTVKHLYISADK